MITLRQIHLRKINILDKTVENIGTHILYSINPLRNSCHV